MGRSRGIAIFVALLICGLPGLLPAQTSLPDTSLAAPDEFRYFDAPIDPDIYLIRPGDQLRVTFIGARIAPVSFSVDPEGRIVDQTLGIIDLSGMTLTRAQGVLIDILERHYTVDEITITISEPQRVAITVSGAVASPGLYLGYTSQRVSEIIEKAGGIQSIGSHRRIRFIDESQHLDVDLERAHRLGQRQYDPPLYAGSHIEVPAMSDRTVHVMGEVVEPRAVEFRPGDNIATMIGLCGGITSLGDSSSIMVRSPFSGETQPDGELSPGMVVVVPRMEDVSESATVLVSGAVDMPGIYAYRDGMTIGDLISEAGDYEEDANQSMVTVFRQIMDDNRSSLRVRRFPLTAHVGGINEFTKTELKPRDSVVVPRQLGFVRVSGMVPNPGYIAYKKGQTALEYIESSGGFLVDADREWIRLRNRVSGTYSLHSPQVIVRDGDEIQVRRKEGDQ